MNIVTDEVYEKTILEAKDIITKIMNNKSNNNGKVVLINTMPTFSFKLFIIFIGFGEYLRNKGYNVKYLLDDNFFKHCDMVSMSENLDKDFLCSRCNLAFNSFKDLSEHFLFFSSFYDNSYDETIHSNTLKYSVERYCGKLNFSKYKQESQENLNKAHNTAKNLFNQYNPSFFVSLTHNSIYSISSMHDFFIKQGVKCLNLDFTVYKENGISFFSKSTDKKIKDFIIENLNFNEDKEQSILNYLNNRTKKKKFSEQEKLLIEKLKSIKEKNKKIVAIFPNVMDDASWEEYHSIFKSPYEWIDETIEFLLKENIFIIVKAHPSELSWNTQEGIVEYLKRKFDSKNIIYIQASDDVLAYNLFDYIDIVNVYTGTLFLESIYKGLVAIPAGNSYIIESILSKKLTKSEYFHSFINSEYLHNELKQNYKKIIKFAYIDFFCREVYLNIFDDTMKYPNVNIDNVNDKIKNSRSFDFLRLIMEGEYFDLEEYSSLFEITTLQRKNI